MFVLNLKIGKIIDDRYQDKAYHFWYKNDAFNISSKKIIYFKFQIKQWIRIDIKDAV